jgi:Protein of unknown function (DUF2877)
MSPLLERVLAGPPAYGVRLSRHHVRFGRYVVSLTPRHSPRMPNGIACEAEAEPGAAIEIGGGALHIGATVITVEDDWDPIPEISAHVDTPWIGRIDAQRLAGRGPGLTPAGDDLLAGYLAGLTLFHSQGPRAAALANEAAALTNSLSATLLLHASRGEVPEPVHDLLRSGDPSSLLRFGHTSGRWWLEGLVLAGYRSDIVDGRSAQHRLEQCSSDKRIAPWLGI